MAIACGNDAQRTIGTGRDDGERRRHLHASRRELRMHSTYGMIDVYDGSGLDYAGEVLALGKRISSLRRITVASTTLRPTACNGCHACKH